MCVVWFNNDLLVAFFCCVQFDRQDFGEFMKANRLAPCSWNKKKGKSPLEKGIDIT